MKTTVDIPEAELSDAMRFTGARTKREAVVSAVGVPDAVAVVLGAPAHARRRPYAVQRAHPHLRTVTEYRVFPSWKALMPLLATGGTAAQPP